jgi:tripartite ATP-independent transporter DctM subunit
MLISVVLLLSLAIGVPIAFAVMLAIFTYLTSAGMPVTLLAQRTFMGLDSFSILAIPLFVLAGELMNASGITGRIIQLANALVGHFKAGLAQVNVWASVIFAGLSGSAVADTSALGRVFVPAMEKEGYPKSFAAALTASSSVIGPIIPPSIPAIIYALIVPGVSVPALFLAGVVPGVLLATMLSIYVFVFAGHYASRHPRLSLKDKLVALKNGLVPLLMPVFIVVSIVAGVVTPTEAAAFAAAYALFAGFVLLKSLKLKDLPGIFVTSMRDSSTILLIIGVVAAANWLMTFNGIPQAISAYVLDMVTSPFTFLMLILVLLLVVGFLLEGMAAMLVLVPILHPIAMSFGIDPVHFAIVVIFNLMIGLITPPMGLCLFVADSVSNVGMAALTRRIIPLFLVEVLVLLIITFVPATVTTLPRLFGF